jgi:hypothetical protein
MIEGSMAAKASIHRRGPTKRQLALIAWTVANPPPGATYGEQAMLCEKLTHWLTDDEQRQVSEFIADETAMRRALKKQASKPWR